MLKKKRKERIEQKEENINVDNNIEKDNNINVQLSNQNELNEKDNNINLQLNSLNELNEKETIKLKNGQSGNFIQENNVDIKYGKEN